jgi:hypothetical protein
MDDHSIQSFIDRWTSSGGAERANYQLFLAELCDVLALPSPLFCIPHSAFGTPISARSVRCDNRDGTHSTRRAKRSNAYAIRDTIR